MTTAHKRAFLFANGPLDNPTAIIQWVQEDDILIAVDGGLQHLTRLGLTPDLIIGDLDSADPAAVKKFQDQGVPVKQYPVAKDETDLSLALETAVAMGAGSLRLVAALGGRLDQTLANIFLLTQKQFLQRDLKILSTHQEIFIIQQSAVLHGAEGQRVSLLPLHGPARGIETRGLAYPLQHETLYPEKTRGVSNRMTGNEASISVQKGLLLCIHETKTTRKKE